jgi:hypothetical protein
MAMLLSSPLILACHDIPRLVADQTMVTVRAMEKAWTCILTTA